MSFASLIPLFASLAIPAVQEFMGGTKGQMQQVPLRTRAQRRELEKRLKMPLEQQPGYMSGQNALMDILNQSPGYFSRLEAPLHRQFQEQIIPGVLERFGPGGGTGAGGLAGSSALNQALARATERFGETLSSQRFGMIPNAISQQLAYSQAPYNVSSMLTGQQQYQPVYSPPTGGAAAPLIQGFSQGFGQASAPMFTNMLKGLMPGMGV